MNIRRLASAASALATSLFTWLALEQAASAQTALAQAALTQATLLAQTGTTKTAIGWGIAALCIGLGLLVVTRTSIRNPGGKPKAKAKK